MRYKHQIYGRVEKFLIPGSLNDHYVWSVSATFLYPTPGEEGLIVALEILKRKKEIVPNDKITIPMAPLPERM